MFKHVLSRKKIDNNESQAIGDATERKLQGKRERALTTSQTVSHANSEVGNTSTDYGLNSGCGMK